MLAGKTELGMTIKTARVFIDDNILSFCLSLGPLESGYLTLMLGRSIFDPLNFSTFTTSDLRCSKKQDKGNPIVLTVGVKSWRRSVKISESLSRVLRRLLCSPSATADAMEAIIDTLDWECDPRWGVPKSTTPATDLMTEG